MRRFVVEGCRYCDRERAAHPDAERLFMPPHDASQRCESGKHEHCSCGICF